MKNSWKILLKTEGKKPYFQNIVKNLEEHAKTNVIWPASSDLFRAFNYFELRDIKVLILGQDPYYTRGVADGLAFSTRSDKTPPSLNNMFIELKKDYPDTKIESNSLENWAKQGVLLLNTVLSVDENKPLSHETFGWQIFTNFIIDCAYKVNPDLIFVALGNKAKEVYKSLKIPEKNIIFLSHPSPLSYNRSFKDGKLFLKINKKLEELNEKPINWDTYKEEQ